MPKNLKGKTKVQHELEENADYSALSTEKNIKDPKSGELISEREYMRRFNNEWYYGSRNGKFKVIKTESGQKEARRNNNSNYRDAVSYSGRNGILSDLTGDETEFMNDASDAWEWQDVYKYAGPEQAKHVIFEQAKRDITAGIIELNVILSRFIIKMMKLKTFNERRRKQGNSDEN